jgi:hypothetical protein
MQSEPAAPPILTSLPPVGGVPPPLTPPPTPTPGAPRSWLAIVLSLFVWIYLVDAVVSLADDSLGLANIHALTTFRLLTGFVALFMSLLVYVLMAFMPVIPKRWFVPLALSGLVLMLVDLPLGIYYYQQAGLVSWLTSLFQVVFGLVVLYGLKNFAGGRLGWPLIPAARLAGPGFGWRNLVAFIGANLLGLLPAMVLYLYLCTSMTIAHFSDGFLTLHPGGFTVQARKYVRNDGKTIQLFPMSHVADADFYRDITRAFPSNSIILMEGVTDEQHLLTNEISYKRLAKSLGLAEQHEAFAPKWGKIVRADVDIDQFSTNTIAVLNLAMLIHTHGLNSLNPQDLMSYTTTPDLPDELINDLLRKRNAHLLAEVRNHLTQTDYIIIPWGAAHMPGIAQGIQKEGFHLEETHDYWVIRF